jgi:prepilin-type processing-associated H-X9-DG protein
VAIGLHGGKDKSPSAVSNYGFIDGHAATLTFDQVYTAADRNRFYPEIAQ